MTIVLYSFASLFVFQAHASTSIFRCISADRGTTVSGMNPLPKYAGIDLEVTGGFNGLRNGYFVSVRPLVVNDNGEVLGPEKTSGLQKPVHDQLQLVAEMAIKTKLYLRINTNGENAGKARGYIESVWSNKKIYWRDQSGIFTFRYDSQKNDCVEFSK